MAENDVLAIDTIIHLKRQNPFVPFLILMASGDRYRIDDPNALAIATNQLHYYPRSGMGIHMRLYQVVAVEVESEKRTRRRRVG